MPPDLLAGMPPASRGDQVRKRASCGRPPDRWHSGRVRQTWLAAAVGLLVSCGSYTGESSAVRKQDEGSSTAVVRGQPRRCIADGPRPEREVISQFFEAYNRGDAAEVRRLADVTELWDPAGAPHHNTLRPDVGFWVASGQLVRPI